MYHNQFLYTQGNGQRRDHRLPDGTQTPAPPIFIANNAVHEYTSQAAVTETIGLKGVADVRLADATAARAAAEYEVARRGLVATVVGLYYMLTASEHKVTVAERAENEAAGFTDLTSKRETAREVAHADVVKAQLQQQQRERDLADARLAADKARLELGVLLFPDPRTSYATESTPLPAMPSRADVEARGGCTQSGVEERAGCGADERCGGAGCAGRVSSGSGVEFQLRHRRSAVCHERAQRA